MASRKKLTVVFGSVALAVVILMTVSVSRELMVFSYLKRLRADEEYLQRIVDSPPETLRGQAIRRFLATPQGSQRLLSTYVMRLREHEWVERQLNGLLNGDVSAIMLWVPPEQGGGLFVGLVEESPPRIRRYREMPLVSGSKWSALQALLVETGCRDATLPTLPEVSFGIVRVELEQKGDFRDAMYVTRRRKTEPTPYADRIRRAQDAESSDTDPAISNTSWDR